MLKFDVSFLEQNPIKCYPLLGPISIVIVMIIIIIIVIMIIIIIMMIVKMKIL